MPHAPFNTFFDVYTGPGGVLRPPLQLRQRGIPARVVLQNEINRGDTPYFFSSAYLTTSYPGLKTNFASVSAPGIVVTPFNENDVLALAGTLTFVWTCCYQETISPTFFTAYHRCALLPYPLPF